MTKQKSKPEDAPEVEAETEMSGEAAVLLEELKAELDEAIAARQRALADFANYQRRASDNEVRARHDGAAQVVRGLLGVLDHFDLALGQHGEEITVEQLFGGVKIVHDELMKALEVHGVQRIEPAAGDEFDPTRHEAVMHQPAPDIEPNHIVSMLQAGYALGQTVLRPAKVALAAPAAPEGRD